MRQTKNEMKCDIAKWKMRWKEDFSVHHHAEADKNSNSVGSVHPICLKVVNSEFYKFIWVSEPGGKS